MKIVICGGTGQIGELLVERFHMEGWEVVVLSRNPTPAPSALARVVAWDGKSRGAWCEELEGAEVVVNLAGKSVNCRYHARNRREMIESRLHSTRILRQAIQRAVKPPKVWLQASTATLYAHRYDEANDEDTGIIGGNEPGVPETWRFSIDLAKRWEETALAGPALPATRLVLLRSAIVMRPSRGGAFDILLRLVRFGLGGQSGDGRQYVSWIHEEDFARAIEWIIQKKDLAGVVNLAAPAPLPNRVFMACLRKAWGIGWGLPAPAWLLEIGAVGLRTESELVLKSRRVVPTRLLQSGFTFRFNQWDEASRDLCQRWKKVA